MDKTYYLFHTIKIQLLYGMPPSQVLEGNVYTFLNKIYFLIDTILHSPFIKVIFAAALVSLVFLIIYDLLTKKEKAAKQELEKSIAVKKLEAIKGQNKRLGDYLLRIKYGLITSREERMKRFYRFINQNLEFDILKIMQDIERKYGKITTVTPPQNSTDLEKYDQEKIAYSQRRRAIFDAMQLSPTKLEYLFYGIQKYLTLREMKKESNKKSEIQKEPGK